MNFPSYTAIFRWQPACWLRVTGSDAASFLQGQFTNELRGIAPRAAVYGLWLNVKGKVVADSFVVKGGPPDEFWIGSYFCQSEVIRERLESYVIADDVVIEDQTGAWSGVTLFGAESEPPLTETAAAEPGFRFRGRRSQPAPFEWVYPESAAAQVNAQVAGGRELNPADILRLRIEAGIPAVPTDIGLTDLPNEGGLHEDAISYTKGCYLGQEVMARLRTMGQVRRRLLRVRGEPAMLPPLPAPLFADARRVGELRSALAAPDGIRGLAMITLMHVQPDTRLSFAAEGPTVVQLVDAP